MSAWRYPVLLWRDQAGTWTAAAVDANTEVDAVAFANESGDALRQLEEFLHFTAETDAWADEPDVLDPALLTFRVTVRPTYRTGNRLYPCAESIDVHVPCVFGKREQGPYFGALPTMGIEFHFAQQGDLKELVSRFVHEHLEGSTPAELARFLPPAESMLQEIVIHARPRYRDDDDDLILPTLRAIAEPIDVRQGRRQFGAAWGYESQVECLAERLSNESASQLLVGEPGAGKTTVLVAAVRTARRRLRETGTGPALTQPRYWLTSGARIISGMRYLGEWEERCEQLVAALGETSGILCLESLLECLRVGGDSPQSSVAAFLLPYMKSGELRLVAETNPGELDACRRLLPGFVEQLQILALPEMERQTQLTVVERLLGAGGAHPVKPDRYVAPLIARLLQRFTPYEAFPGAAARFVRDLREKARDANTAKESRAESTEGEQVSQDCGQVSDIQGCGRVSQRCGRVSDPAHSPDRRSPDSQEPAAGDVGRSGDPTTNQGDQPTTREQDRPTTIEPTARRDSSAIPVTTSMVLARFAARTGLPETLLRDDVPMRDEDILRQFRTRIIGQDEACRVMTDLMLTLKAGLNNPARPIGAYLFCGPTGVGKTALALTLADMLFGGAGDSADRMIRMDMSEYAGFDAGDRLFETPDGEPSELIKRLRRQPFCVLLLDEIEKAAPDVFDALLGAFDEGRLTDRFGRTASLRSAVILCTSNLGAGRGASLGFAPATAQSLPDYEHEAATFFRPEFFNRLDGVVTFLPLEPEHVRAITRRELDLLAQREGLMRAGLLLQCSDRLIDHLARVGFDPQYGARPLQRAIERLVVGTLSRYLVAHPDLHDTILDADLENDRVVIAPSSPGSELKDD